MSVAINAGERPRAAAFGSDPRPFLESANGLRPLPAAAAFGRFQGRSLFEVKQEKNGRACQRWDSLIFLFIFGVFEFDKHRTVPRERIQIRFYGDIF